MPFENVTPIYDKAERDLAVALADVDLMNILRVTIALEGMVSDFSRHTKDIQRAMPGRLTRDAVSTADRLREAANRLSRLANARPAIHLHAAE